MGGQWPEIVGKEFAESLREPGADETEPAPLPVVYSDADEPPF